MKIMTAIHHMIIFFSLFFSPTIFAQQTQKFFEPGKVWLDTKGKPIEAHGGGIIKHANIYYWYGENHTLGEGNKIGISCYSSNDLLNWKNEGVVLPKEKLPEMFRDKGVCERPKVIYNPRTQKFVMWMHLDANTYSEAMAGVAIADNPNGPFEFKGYKRPIGYDYGYRLDRVPGINPREKELGNAYRDMNLFVDTDGKAYVIYSSEELATLYCSRLNEEFTDIELPAVQGKTWQRLMPGQFREAPVLFKHEGKYFILSSGTSGWDPNPADLAMAESLFGPYKNLGNPCFGTESETTFRSQSTSIIPLPDKGDGAFIYMGDRWIGSQLEKSTYVWLPFYMSKNGNVKLVSFNQWNLSIFDSLNKPLISPVIKVNPNNSISWKRVANAQAYKIFKNGKLYSITDSTTFTLPPGFAGVIDNYTVQAWNMKGVNSKPSITITKKWPVTGAIFLSDRNPESSKQGWGTLRKDKSIQLSTLNIAGRAFKKGLGTHSYSEVIYRIGGNYKRFSSWIGVDNFAKIKTISSLQFEVWSDGDLLYRSDIMKVNDAAKFIELDITGTNELKLVVTDAGDGTEWDHADWGEAKIEQ